MSIFLPFGLHCTIHTARQTLQRATFLATTLVSRIDICCQQAESTIPLSPSTIAPCNAAASLVPIA